MDRAKQDDDPFANEPRKVELSEGSRFALVCEQMTSLLKYYDGSDGDNTLLHLKSIKLARLTAARMAATREQKLKLESGI